MTIKPLVLLFAVTAAPAFAEDLAFILVNNASQPLSNLYVSLPEAEDWGDDILGVDVLAPGEMATVTITDGAEVCAFDMQFVMENAASIEGTADLCENDTFTLTDN